MQYHSLFFCLAFQSCLCYLCKTFPLDMFSLGAIIKWLLLRFPWCHRLFSNLLPPAILLYMYLKCNHLGVNRRCKCILSGFFHFWHWHDYALWQFNFTLISNIPCKCQIFLLTPGSTLASLSLTNHVVQLVLFDIRNNKS